MKILPCVLVLTTGCGGEEEDDEKAEEVTLCERPSRASHRHSSFRRSQSGSGLASRGDENVVHGAFCSTSRERTQNEKAEQVNVELVA